MTKGTEQSEQQLWDALAALPPASVCERAGVSADQDASFTSAAETPPGGASCCPAGSAAVTVGNDRSASCSPLSDAPQAHGMPRYFCTCFGQTITVDVQARELAADSPAGQLLLGRLAYFSRLALLNYLVNAKDVPLSGQWVAPSELSAAQLYFRGSHVLPLDRLAAVYGAAPERFLAQGATLGGERVVHGNVALRLLALPRVPILLVLWAGDDEFPARANLLFDATCKLHLPPDLVWSTAMMTILLMTFDLGA